MSELQFKRWFVEAWGGWLVRIEPRQGGDVGVSDLMVVVDGRLIPVELKVMVEGKVSGIRPSQKVWHRQAAAAGLVTLLCAGEKGLGKGWSGLAWVWGGKARGQAFDRSNLVLVVSNMVREEWSRR